MFCLPCIVIYIYIHVIYIYIYVRTIRTNRMHYLLSIHFNKDPANSQSTYTHDIHHCCLYREVPPDDEQ